MTTPIKPSERYLQIFRRLGGDTSYNRWQALLAYLDEREVDAPVAVPEPARPKRFTAPERLPIGAKVRIVELGSNGNPRHSVGDCALVIPDDSDQEYSEPYVYAGDRGGQVDVTNTQVYLFWFPYGGGGSWVRTVELVEETDDRASLHPIARERDEALAKLAESEALLASAASDAASQFNKLQRVRREVRRLNAVVRLCNLQEIARSEATRQLGIKHREVQLQAEHGKRVAEREEIRAELGEDIPW